jgi:hypothetical protein
MSPNQLNAYLISGPYVTGGILLIRAETGTQRVVSFGTWAVTG